MSDTLATSAEPAPNARHFLAERAPDCLDTKRSKSKHPRFPVLAVGIIAGVAVILLAILTKSSWHDKQPIAGSEPAVPTSIGYTIPTSASSVPFVGCKSDGQNGPEEAPSGSPEVVLISAQDAQRLAYYKSKETFGVLAPRDWHCFAVYGSNGESLFVSPDPINSANFFSDGWKGFTGPAIQISHLYGGTSGRFSVAKTIAQVFPAHRIFAEEVIKEGIEPASSFPFGPYPNDKLTYRSDEIVEYQTPAYAEGLGTKSRLQSDANPISGVAILTGRDPDLVQLSLRLPPDDTSLAAAITWQVEVDSAGQPQNSVTAGQSQDVKDVDRKLFECLAPKAQYGEYSSYDGGKSAGELVTRKCFDESEAWIKSCHSTGDSEDICLAKALGIAQLVIKQFGK
jgi:hypothetical protein